jgi:D-tyrosyl-tRNA(Tyr) deacylase
MRLVIQRVSDASVRVDDGKKTLGKIDKGFFVLLGVGKGDNKKNADILAKKLVKLRIMADTENKMNLTVGDVGGKVLVVSQFTLYADTSKGNRPSFFEAADPKKANELYEYFVKRLKNEGVGVETGNFGDYMLINAELDGPVTLLLESDE